MQNKMKSIVEVFTAKNNAYSQKTQQKLLTLPDQILWIQSGSIWQNKLIKYLNKHDKDNKNKIKSLMLSLICAKISLPEVCWSHRVNLCGKDGDIWKLLND